MTTKFEGSTAQEDKEGSKVEQAEAQEPQAEKAPVDVAYDSLAAKGKKLAKAEESLEWLKANGHTERAKKMLEDSQAELDALRADFEKSREAFSAEFEPMRAEIASEGEEIIAAREEAPESFEDSQKRLQAKNAEAIAQAGFESSTDMQTGRMVDGKEVWDKEEPAAAEKTGDLKTAAELAMEKTAHLAKKAEAALAEAPKAEAGEPAAAIEAKPGRVIDEGVQAEALDDFRRGLKGEKKEGQEKPSKWGKTWGWLKRRMKGLATLGITSFHQGEKMRSGTGEVAKDLSEKGYAEMQKNIKRVGGGISQEGVDRRLTLEESLEEAERMQEMSKAEGKQETTKADLENYSKAVTAEKIVENDALVGKLVAGAEAKLKDKLSKYRDEFDQSVLTPEKLAKFREKMTEQMRDLRQGIETQNGVLEFIGSDKDRMKQIMRESFDKGYWKHYVYGGLEAAVGLIAAKIVLGKMLAESAIAAVPGAPPAAPPVPTGFEMPTGLKMDGSVWNTAQEYLQTKMGIANPTDGQIMKLTHALSQDNGVGVAEWAMKGSPMDTGMAQGYGLKVGTAAQAAITALRMVI